MKHRWSEPERFCMGAASKSERTCLNGCGVVKVTRHEPNARPKHWAEFWKDEERMPGSGTPRCNGDRNAVHVE
jgi:hypothetical protein